MLRFLSVPHDSDIVDYAHNEGNRLEGAQNQLIGYLNHPRSHWIKVEVKKRVWGESFTRIGRQCYER